MKKITFYSLLLLAACHQAFPQTAYTLERDLMIMDHMNLRRYLGFMDICDEKCYSSHSFSKYDCLLCLKRDKDYYFLLEGERVTVGAKEESDITMSTFYGNRTIYIWHVRLSSSTEERLENHINEIKKQELSDYWYEIPSFSKKDYWYMVYFYDGPISNE